jgi:hypothetical protein
MTFVWVHGCRSGSNLVGAFLSKCAGPVGTSSPSFSGPECDPEWNPQWVEDSFILWVVGRACGHHPVLQMNCPTLNGPLDPALVTRLLDHLSGVRARAQRDAVETVVVKFSNLCWFWTHVAAALPTDRHVLVCAKRNRKDRVGSVKRVHAGIAGVTDDVCHAFFDAHDRNTAAIERLFSEQGHLVVACDYDAVKRDPTVLDAVARQVGLEPTDAARSLFDPKWAHSYE